VQKSGPVVAVTDSGAHDLGLALNDYLLGRLELSEREALYESTRVSLRRRADDRPVDIFEFYWADLSRLAEGGLLRISARSNGAMRSARATMSGVSCGRHRDMCIALRWSLAVEIDRLIEG
jgi:hypothetical protein